MSRFGGGSATRSADTASPTYVTRRGPRLFNGGGVVGEAAELLASAPPQGNRLRTAAHVARHVDPIPRASSPAALMPEAETARSRRPRAALPLKASGNNKAPLDAARREDYFSRREGPQLPRRNSTSRSQSDVPSLRKEAEPTARGHPTVAVEHHASTAAGGHHHHVWSPLHESETMDRPTAVSTPPPPPPASSGSQGSTSRGQPPLAARPTNASSSSDASPAAVFDAELDFIMAREEQLIRLMSARRDRNVEHRQRAREEVAALQRELDEVNAQCDELHRQQVARHEASFRRSAVMSEAAPRSLVQSPPVTDHRFQHRDAAAKPTANEGAALRDRVARLEALVQQMTDESAANESKAQSRECELAAVRREIDEYEGELTERRANTPSVQSALSAAAEALQLAGGARLRLPMMRHQRDDNATLIHALRNDTRAVTETLMLLISRDDEQIRRLTGSIDDGRVETDGPAAAMDFVRPRGDQPSSLAALGLASSPIRGPKSMAASMRAVGPHKGGGGDDTVTTPLTLSVPQIVAALNQEIQALEASVCHVVANSEANRALANQAIHRLEGQLKDLEAQAERLQHQRAGLVL